MDGKELFLTVPIRKSPQSTYIRDIEISSHGLWWQNHWKTLFTCYSKTPGWKVLVNILEDHYRGPVEEKLAQFNGRIIEKIFEVIGISAKLVYANDLACQGPRSEHLLRIVRALGCDEYLSPVGSSDYLYEDGFDTHKDVKLLFQEYEPRVYLQYNSQEFVPRLSIVDVIANLGLDGAIKYIK
jgi:hypothetical protein